MLSNFITCLSKGYGSAIRHLHFAIDLQVGARAWSTRPGLAATHTHTVPAGENSRVARRADNGTLEGEEAEKKNADEQI